MKAGFIITTADPTTATELASEAETAGWDGGSCRDAVRADIDR